jgi:hypothetical protein
MVMIAQSQQINGDTHQEELQLNLPPRGVSGLPLCQSMESPMAVFFGEDTSHRKPLHVDDMSNDVLQAEHRSEDTSAKTPRNLAVDKSPMDAYFNDGPYTSFHIEAPSRVLSRMGGNPTLLQGLTRSSCSSVQEKVDRPHSHGTFPQKSAQGASVQGHVWSLSQDADGCREVQEAFEAAADERARVLLAMELVGHVREAVQCPHANHVLRKCINTMHASSVQFIIDEFVKGGAEAMGEAARHRYGCRILEALMKKCSLQQLYGLLQYFLTDSLALTLHMYGNFIVQRLIEYGTEDHRHFLCAMIRMNIVAVATNFYGAVVVGSALTHGSQQDQLLLARAVISVNGLLKSVMRFRHGESVKQRLFEILQPSDYQQATSELQATPLRIPRNIQAPAGRDVDKIRSSFSDMQAPRAHRFRRQAGTKM